MEIGIIGLGRMGKGVAERLANAGHAVHVFNRTQATADEVAGAIGATAHASVKELVAGLAAPRTLWLYLPSGETTESHLKELLSLLEPGDTIIDGGNSDFRSTRQVAPLAEEKGVHFLDVGTSGGLAGQTDGYCLMIGGSKETYQRLTPLWEAVAQKDGHVYAGKAGAGHYVKMVHNAIEYGMMQSYGEGMALLQASEYGADMKMNEVAHVWQRGSIIRSYLGELLAEGLDEQGNLSALGERIDDNGEGKWAVEEALRLNVAAPSFAAAMFARYVSRGNNGFAHKVVALLRHKFGGHALHK